MYSKSAHLYDAIYSFKEFDGEAESIISLVDSERPNAKTLLDVACGPHEHVKVLQRRFAVDGLDLNEDFLPIAGAKNPRGTYYQGDMKAFELGRRYDVLLCLSSSVGYLRNFGELVATLQCFSRHITSEGLIIIEPWYTPSTWTPGRIAVTVGEKDATKIVRVGARTSEGTSSRIRFHYMVVSLDECEVFHEDHHLQLFSQEQFGDAFHRAGLRSRHNPEWSKGRGLYVAQRAPG